MSYKAFGHIDVLVYLYQKRRGWGEISYLVGQGSSIGFFLEVVKKKFAFGKFSALVLCFEYESRLSHVNANLWKLRTWKRIQIGMYHLDSSFLTVVSFLCCVHMRESGEGMGNYSLPTCGFD